MKTKDFGPQVDKHTSHIRHSQESPKMNESKEKLLAPDYPVFEFNEEENFEFTE